MLDYRKFVIGQRVMLIGFPGHFSEDSIWKRLLPVGITGEVIKPPRHIEEPLIRWVNSKNGLSRTEVFGEDVNDECRYWWASNGIWKSPERSIEDQVKDGILYGIPLD